MRAQPSHLLGSVLTLSLLLALSACSKRVADKAESDVAESAAVPVVTAPASTATPSGDYSDPSAAITRALTELAPNIQITAVADSPIPGLYEVTVGRRVVYVTGDGQYLVDGMMLRTTDRINLTEERHNGLRMQALESMPADERIIYPAADRKYKVTVFTDIDCGFCRKLHQEMADYNASGIEIDYVFFPRGGQRTPGFQKAVSVWCADDRNLAMDQAKAGQEMPVRECDSPINRQYQIGMEIGITGTPALVTEDGTILPGYVPAAELRGRLDQMAASKSN